MVPELIERVLDAWDRGAGLTVDEQVSIALDGIDPKSGRPAASQGVHERDLSLLNLHRRLFGHRVDGVVRCPKCALEFDLALDLDRLEYPTASCEPFRLEHDGIAAWVRAPMAADLAALGNGLAEADFAQALFVRCVEHPTSAGVDIAATDLPTSFRQAVSAELAARGMEGPTLDLGCGECGWAWRAPVDIARTVLREIEHWVWQLLDDVHQLAAAYHWSEKDIIGLPLRRRLFYLEAIR